VNPYYSDDLVTLYHGDCLEASEWLAADVLVTDPPYGVRYVCNRRPSGPSAPIAGDRSTALRDEALAEWGSRPALVFGTWRAPRPAGVKHRLIWDKCLVGSGNLTLPWGPSDEEIYVLGDWPPIRPGGRAREGGKPARGSSVLRVQGYPANHRPDHPTPKPVDLLAQLLERCPPGVVADPFAGSGPTLLAARKLGRRVVGVEVEERYCELIANRLSKPTTGALFEVAS
jgi:DNA modification methylase